jgi:D-lactate dehydrogenase (cytochrome)
VDRPNAAALGETLAPDYVDYLRDESRLEGQAERICFPDSEERAQKALETWAGAGSLVTVQGARTGITGGAVPRGGCILNLSRMNRFLGLRRVDDPARTHAAAEAAGADAGTASDNRAGKGSCYLLRIQPGVLLAELNQALQNRDLPSSDWSDESLKTLEQLQKDRAVFFPPDPTETSASLGGMTANNASGARSFGYGPTRRYIYYLRLLLPDGCPVALRRGTTRAEGLRFRLDTGCDRTIAGDIPGYRMPVVKNAAGLYCRPDMELIDLVIGSEGTLGVITELEVLLIPKPEAIAGLMVFFPDEEAVVPFVSRLRGDATNGYRSEAGSGGGARLAAIEFFDARALELLSRQKEGNPTFAELPGIPSGQRAAVYVEIHGTEADERILALSELLEECGGDASNTWLAESSRELERLKEFRHALPEAVNLTIDERRQKVPELVKLGTDMSVPDGALSRILERYRRDLAASELEYVMFGHIGSNHIHVNILPRSMEEYQEGRALYGHWAEEVVRLGGSVSAEHGIGKLKTDLLRLMYGNEGIREMRQLIESFNPGQRMNRGNMIGTL